MRSGFPWLVLSTVFAAATGVALGSALAGGDAPRHADRAAVAPTPTPEPAPRVGLARGPVRLPLPAGWEPLRRHSALPGFKAATAVQAAHSTVALDLRAARARLAAAARRRPPVPARAAGPRAAPGRHPPRLGLRAARRGRRDARGLALAADHARRRDDRLRDRRSRAAARTARVHGRDERGGARRRRRAPGRARGRRPDRAPRHRRAPERRAPRRTAQPRRDALARPAGARRRCAWRAHTPRRPAGCGRWPRAGRGGSSPRSTR